MTASRALAPASRGMRRLGYLALALLAYVPVLLSSPGKVAADTKTYLYLDPARLLSRAPTMLDPNVRFGTVTPCRGWRPRTPPPPTTSQGGGNTPTSFWWCPGRPAAPVEGVAPGRAAPPLVGDPMAGDEPAAAAGMVPVVRGEETDLIEIPASWYLDDLPPMMFIKTAPNSHGFVNPRDIEQLWLDQFDWVYREHDYAVYTMTIHPDVSGRPAVLAMHERIIEHINRHDGVRWATFDEIADDFARRSPRGG